MADKPVLDESTRARIRTELEDEAVRYAAGEMKEAPVYGTRREEIPGTQRITGRDNITLFRNRFNFNRSYDSVRRTAPLTREVREQVGTRGVPVVYPSPGDAAPSVVLEQFFQDNLYKQPVRFSDEVKLPFIVAEVQQAHRDALRNPANDREQPARDSSGRVYGMVSAAEREYVQRIATEDKDKVALDIMRGLRDAKKAEMVLESGQQSSGALLLRARGNGTDHTHGKTHYDGGFTQMMNYLDAVERNKDKYAGGGLTYGDYFARAASPEYAPTAERVSPLTGMTVRQQGQKRVAELVAQIDGTVAAMKQAMAQDRGGFRDSSQRSAAPVVGVLEQLRHDMADGIIGNSGADYRVVDALLPGSEEMQRWMKVRKELAADTRVDNPALATLEQDRATVVQALRQSQIAPKKLQDNPQLAEALSHVVSGIGIEFTPEAKPQTPLPAATRTGGKAK